MAMSWDFGRRQWVPWDGSTVIRDHRQMVDAEIEELKRRYVQEQITLEEFETQVGDWIKWEQMNPMERIEFERTHDSIRWEENIFITMHPPPDPLEYR